jgi:uncharacterized protein (DUF302 family)
MTFGGWPHPTACVRVLLRRAQYVAGVPDQGRIALSHQGEQQSLTSTASARPVVELIERLEAALAAKGITVFARIDHAAGATSIGMALRPTTVLIFGNPRAGTPLMQAEPLFGLDLPLRILAWEDAEGGAWLTYHDLATLARYHGVDPTSQPTLPAMTALLRALVDEAIG